MKARLCEARDVFSGDFRGSPSRQAPPRVFDLFKAEGLSLAIIKGCVPVDGSRQMTKRLRSYG
ncbi:MAG: hypothetical protein CMJ64_25475 [Planctomycetaceae bacterium]|nr:hypothetical protein [Planctomycetaceae bacterium]